MRVCACAWQAWQACSERARVRARVYVWALSVGRQWAGRAQRRTLPLTLTLTLTRTRTLALTLTLNLTLTLTLARCGVGNAAASALCDASPSLTGLDLHSNQLGQRAAVALGTLPTLTPTLTIALTVTTSTLRILTRPASERQP